MQVAQTICLIVLYNAVVVIDSVENVIRHSKLGNTRHTDQRHAELIIVMIFKIRDIVQQKVEYGMPQMWRGDIAR